MYIFFFIDDFSTVFFPKHADHAAKVEDQLKKEIEVTGGAPIHRLLGMKITRDRASRTLWVDQEAYIEKMATQYKITLNTKPPRSPLPSHLDLSTPEGHMASHEEIKAFQARIGTINLLPLPQG